MYVYIVGIIVSEFIIINISKKNTIQVFMCLKKSVFSRTVFSCVLKFNSKENNVFHNFNFYTFWKKGNIVAVHICKWMSVSVFKFKRSVWVFIYIKRSNIINYQSISLLRVSWFSLKAEVYCWMFENVIWASYDDVIESVFVYFLCSVHKYKKYTCKHV